MKILDIDLDFFLNNRYCGTVTSTNRLDGRQYKPWGSDEVEEFMEQRCGLDKSKKIKGRLFTHHDEVFYYLRGLQEAAGFELKFDIDHVDAHADLGQGDSSFIYIATEILSKSIKERAYPQKINGWYGLSAGNFLYFAIAARWITKLSYVGHMVWRDDIPWFNFKDFDVKSETLQLKQFSVSQLDNIMAKVTTMQQVAKSLTPLSIESEVPFQFLDHQQFKSEDEYELIFLTQSPGFTPESADKLIPIITQYMDLSS